MVLLPTYLIFHDVWELLLEHGLDSCLLLSVLELGVDLEIALKVDWLCFCARPRSLLAQKLGALLGNIQRVQ